MMIGFKNRFLYPDANYLSKCRENYLSKGRQNYH